MLAQTFFDRFYNLLLSKKAKEKAENGIIWVAIISFITHLMLIVLNQLEVFPRHLESELLVNPISAIYTPFSFILLFEVYLLVYHLPESTSTYIGKQYEIITLIVVRRLFKDISHIDLNTNWFESFYDLQFTYDIISTLILFYLIYWFQKLNKKKKVSKGNELEAGVKKFIQRKKILASILVPTVVVMALYSFSSWLGDSVLYLFDESKPKQIIDINKIFYDEFFMILILTDVFLLLLSFFHTSKFHLFIRNSGFIISTILLRVSFGVEGFINNILIIVAVLFGVLILYINRLYAKGFS